MTEFKGQRLIDKEAVETGKVRDEDMGILHPSQRDYLWMVVKK